MTYQSRLAGLLQKAGVDEATVEESNRRWANRKSATTPAQIRFEGTTVPFECIIKDISSTGAKLEMAKSRFNSDASSDAIPNQFTLIVPLDRIAVDCVSMWRRGTRLGVHFTGIVRQLPPAPKAVRRSK